MPRASTFPFALISSPSFLSLAAALAFATCPAQAQTRSVRLSLQGATLAMPTHEPGRAIDVEPPSGRGTTVTRDAELSAVPAAVPARAVPGSTRDTGRVTIGDTVRLFGRRSKLADGVVVGVDSGVLLVRDAQDGDTRTVFRADAVRGEVKRGDRRRGLQSVRTGALIGAGFGTVFLALGGAASHDQHDEGIAMAIGLFAATASVTLGTVAGAIASVTWTDAWFPFDPRTLTQMPKGA